MAAAEYPEQWASDVALADGSTVHVRPIRPDDRERLRAFHGRQSAESIYLRYFTPRPTLSEADLDHFTRVDYRDRMAFVAVSGGDILAVARYDRWAGRDDAEVAFMVDDEHHGLGIGTVLLEFLAEAARQVGFRRFSAQVLPSNRKMLRVFRQAGFEVTSEFGDGVIEVELDIEPTPEALAAIEARSHLAEARSVARLLAPQAVAVIGAGREPGGLGHEVVANLLADFSAVAAALGRDDSAILADLPDELSSKDLVRRYENLIGTAYPLRDYMLYLFVRERVQPLAEEGTSAALLWCIAANCMARPLNLAPWRVLGCFFAPGYQQQRTIN